MKQKIMIRDLDYEGMTDSGCNIHSDTTNNKFDVYVDYDLYEKCLCEDDMCECINYLEECF